MRLPKPLNLKVSCQCWNQPNKLFWWEIIYNWAQLSFVEMLPRLVLTNVYLKDLSWLAINPSDYKSNTECIRISVTSLQTHFMMELCKMVLPKKIEKLFLSSHGLKANQTFSWTPMDSRNFLHQEHLIWTEHKLLQSTKSSFTWRGQELERSKLVSSHRTRDKEPI